ncbi:uncharacterized protein EV422DRAFT_508701 [Fimicolochytrium jonesii]|uniref:uncharacterized protein n=1 Tax=Fimicolochytrium jonesii TaxID=1396493 RepID=UPI0022FE10A0|nr:uncharacterized protein EV422DRAFT_508701 [Fimicolochytrium jonesii]KAI8817879.1 hypothetical protein EV422DRAFT_508701 [Fimicolochytrium jonesii]
MTQHESTKEEAQRYSKMYYKLKQAPTTYIPSLSERTNPIQLFAKLEDFCFFFGDGLQAEARRQWIPPPAVWIAANTFNGLVDRRRNGIAVRVWRGGESYSNKQEETQAAKRGIRWEPWDTNLWDTVLAGALKGAVKGALVALGLKEAETIAKALFELILGGGSEPEISTQLEQIKEALEDLDHKIDQNFHAIMAAIKTMPAWEALNNINTDYGLMSTYMEAAYAKANTSQTAYNDLYNHALKVQQWAPTYANTIYENMVHDPSMGGLKAIWTSALDVYRDVRTAATPSSKASRFITPVGYGKPQISSISLPKGITVNEAVRSIALGLEAQLDTWDAYFEVGGEVADGDNTITVNDPVLHPTYSRWGRALLNAYNTTGTPQANFLWRVPGDEESATRHMVTSCTTGTYITHNRDAEAYSRDDAQGAFLKWADAPVTFDNPEPNETFQLTVDTKLNSFHIRTFPKPGCTDQIKENLFRVQYLFKESLHIGDYPDFYASCQVGEEEPECPPGEICKCNTFYFTLNDNGRFQVRSNWDGFNELPRYRPVLYWDFEEPKNGIWVQDEGDGAAGAKYEFYFDPVPAPEL